MRSGVGLAGMRGDATVGGDDRAGHARGVVRGEEGDDGRHLPGPGGAPQRDAIEPEGTILGIRDRPRGQFGLDQTRAKRVHANAALAAHRESEITVACCNYPPLA